MALTDKACKAAKPKPRLYKLSDGGGLQLWIYPLGLKSWRYAYRLGRKQLTYSIGRYPAVGLAEAREAHRDAQKSRRQGTDPSKAKRAARASQGTCGDAFDVLVDEYLGHMRSKGRSEETILRNTWVLDAAKRRFAGRKVSSLARNEIWEIVDAVQQRGKFETARKTCQCISAVIRRAINTGRAVADPTVGLTKEIARPEATPRAAITEPKKLSQFLVAADGYGGAITTVAGLQLTAMLFPRPGDLRKMKFSDLDFDNAFWTVRKAVKTGKTYFVPLPHQAVTLLRSLELIARSELVFPNNRSIMRPMSENTLNAAMRYLGFSSSETCAHGFRTTASTILNETGRWNSDAIERQLDHGFEPVRGAYARGKYWDERVEMMQTWADYLDHLRGFGATAAMVPHLRAVA